MATTSQERSRGSRPDLLAGLIFIAVGALGLWAGRKLPMGTVASMGPGYLPFSISLFLLVIGLAVAAFSFRSAAERMGVVRPRPVLIISFAIIVFAYAAEYLGFLLASVLLIGIASTADRDSRPLEVAISAIALTLFGIAVFIIGLGVQIRLWPI